ncbi:unnamed protein product [Arabidopsis lyrata]|nr:unnamed protein product [Arabidopsis lyrata]
MSADLSPISLSHQLLRLSDYDSSESQIAYGLNKPWPSLKTWISLDIILGGS